MPGTSPVLIRITNKAMKLFYSGRIRGPGGALRRNKKLTKVFIKKPYDKATPILVHKRMQFNLK